ncbi:MAG: methyltransferase domain-containing protein [Chloroflexota bacterium]|nr:methyltransferase domain-containing protein [Chloroflexota bacterium]MDE2920006.1 methyltransferase domain-containing protein [Chloroflexota bacterium]
MTDGLQVPASLAQHYRWILTLASPPPTRLLDVGAGDGRLLQVARDLRIPHRVGLERKRRWRPANPDFAPTIGDAQRLPFPNDTFDCVVENESLEWIKVPVRYLQEAARVCTPTGLVITDDSDWDTLVYAVRDPARARRILRAFCDTGPNGWIGRAAPSLMRQAGLRDIQVHVRVITEREFAPHTLGFHQAQVIDDWLRSVGDITPTQLDDFRADLHHTAQRGDYLFTLNRYICLGQPAQRS